MEKRGIMQDHAVSDFDRTKKACFIDKSEGSVKVAAVDEQELLSHPKALDTKKIAQFDK